MSFVHLHVHSDYSLLDGIGTCQEYGALCHSNGIKQLAITDHGMMAAVPAQTKACIDNDLKPIYGMEAYLNDYHHLVPNFKDLTEAEKLQCKTHSHLVMWARNDEGYKNLVRVSSDAWIKGFYYKPRTNKMFLKEHSEGLIASSACIAGEIPWAILSDDKERARKLLREYREIFPDFYIEIMLLDMEKQRCANQGLIELAREEGCPLVLTNDVHFERLEDHEVQKIALLIQSRNGTISNPAGLQYDAKELWFKNENHLDEYYLAKFADNIPLDAYEEAKDNTIQIANQCDGVEIDTSPKLPVIEDAEKNLHALLKEAMKEKGLRNPEYAERLSGELEIIREKGFASYFLIMKEIVDHVKLDMGSIVGPGRGSGPGFLVNYLLNLCTVDPIKYNLLSERFLSPHRGGKFAKLKFTKQPIRRG